jgi:hypothetical protein
MADLHCFNEEAGEISLSILSRMTQGNTEMRNLDRMARRYRLSRAALQASHFMDRKNSASIVPKRTRKYNIDVNGEEVSTTATFFKKVIRQCLGNVFQTIEPSVEKIKKSSGLNRHLLRASTMPKALRLKRGQVHTLFTAQIKFIRERWIDVTYCDFARSWFDENRSAAAFRRMMAGDDFETVLEEELRSKSDAEDDDPDVEDSGSDDAGTEVNISSDDSEADAPGTDDEYPGMSLEGAGGVVELSGDDDEEKKGNNSSIRIDPVDDDSEGLHFKNYWIILNFNLDFKF